MAGRQHPGSEAEARARGDRPLRAMAITCVIGLLLTAVSAWAAYRADEGTEERLLETQSRQAAAVLETAILNIQQPLMTALQVQTAAGPDGDPAVFRRTFTVNVGKGGSFVAASLWHREGRTLTRLAAVGAPPAIDPRGAEVQALLHRALETSTSVIEQVEMGKHRRIVFAMGDAATGLVVKVERAIPSNRRASVDEDSAYSQLDYAIYLGEQQSAEDLTTTNLDPADLPMTGTTHVEEIPFGDTALTLVTRPHEHLGSPLSQRLPWILLLGGLLLTFATAAAARQFLSVQDRIDRLYEEQRGMFVRLQRAVLPHVDPEIPQLEIASKYVAGTEGIEVGGDWYSIIGIDDDQFAFVVGDVSGKGVDAVAEMARARFTLRAYLLDGNAPDVALEKSSSQFDVAVDDHIVTAVVGRGSWRTGEVVVANAGHPLPVLMTADGTRHVEMPVGPPLGVGASSYGSATFTMPPGSTLLGYTDGLVERRGEDIDAGMQRLVDAADRHRHEPVAALLASLLDEMRGDGAADDIALLAVRRLSPA